MKTLNTPLLRSLIAAIMLGIPACSLAQDVGPALPPEVEEARAYFPAQADERVDALATALIGMHRGNDHALYINEVQIRGVDSALYVEFVAAGSEREPLRQQIWVPHRKGDRLQLRVCDLPLGMKDLVVGMWATPDLFPNVGLGQYSALGDLVVNESGENFTASSANPMPIAIDSAIDYTLRLDRTAGDLRWRDSGNALDGEEIFAVDVEMPRRPALPAATRHESGIVMIDLREGHVGAVASTGDSIAWQYSEWSLDGFLLDTSRAPSTPIAYFTIPDTGKYPQAINDAVLGMREGGIRRVFVPRAKNGLIGGTMTELRRQLPLLYEIECVSLKDNTP